MYMKVRYGTTPPSHTCLSPPKHAVYLRQLNRVASRERLDTDLPTFTASPRNTGTLPRSMWLPRTQKQLTHHVYPCSPPVHPHVPLPLLSHIHNSSLTPAVAPRQRDAGMPPLQRPALL
jgi:hypothetical protein